MRIISFNIVLLLVASLSYGQNVQYAIVHKGVFYVSEQSAEKGRRDRLASYDVKDGDREGFSLVGPMRPSYMPYCWEKAEEEELIYIWGMGRRQMGPVVRLERIALAEGGLLSEAVIVRDSLYASLSDREAEREYLMYSLRSRNKQFFLPLQDWLDMSVARLGKEVLLNDIYRFVSYDLLAGREGGGLEVLLRNKYELSVWRYSYPDSGDALFEARPTSELHEDWEEVVTFSIDTIPFLPAGWAGGDRLLPSGKHHRYRSIPDSAFFQGHFKAIRQGSETFLFNTATGYLYHLGPEDIARVGQVNLQGYPRWLFGQPLFIEDRDAGELVFFVEAERAEGARAFPKVAVVKDRRALNERYPGLAGR
jgi:hypothetical protein